MGPNSLMVVYVDPLDPCPAVASVSSVVFSVGSLRVKASHEKVY